MSKTESVHGWTPDDGIRPFMIGAANAESIGPHQGFTTVTATEGPNL